jgi:sarcosine oxidase subunit gamma
VHDFHALTPLGGSEPRVTRHKDMVLSEITDQSLASVAARLGKEDSAAKLVADFIKAPAPTPGTFAGEVTSAFWMGPDQWMVSAPYDAHPDLAADLLALTKEPISVTEQTDGWCRFDLSGDDIVAVCEILCAVDLRSGQVGDATRTTIDHLGCFVIRREAGKLTVIGPRSSAASLHHAIVTAMHSAL